MISRLHPLLQPYVPSSDEPFNTLRAAHLLNRATFGGRPEEIAAIQELGPDRGVEALLDFPQAGASEQSKTDVPDLSSVGDGYPATFDERRKLFIGKTQEERMALNQMLMQRNREAMAATMQWWLKRMVAGPYPAQEKLTFFWHGHFTSSARDERAASLMWQQNETLRQNAAANFRTLVKQISRDPAMLDYLNNQQNRKEHPNENYARELMELFTLGIGHYTEQDIKEAARAFTGWGHDGEDFIFRKFDHDYGPKTFFGRTGNFDGDEVIDLILQNRQSSTYIAGRLLNYYVQDEPDPAVCQSLGSLLRDSDFDLRPVLSTMFKSKLFYSPEVMGSQIKSPVQLVVGTMRLLNSEPQNMNQVVGALDQMGQVPFAPPNVKGWPGGHMWINTSTIFVRYNTAVWLAGGGQQIEGSRGRGGIGKFVGGRAMGMGRFGNPNFDPAPVGNSHEEIVDAWVNRLIQRPIDESRKQVLKDALGDRPEFAGAVKKMVQLIVSMPEYQLC